MPNQYVKKLTGKDPRDFEFAAAHIINNCDVEAFEALVAQSDFLFDFIKKNVKKRLSAQINAFNYTNLIKFLKTYSPDYEEFIISSLTKYANEDLTDEMLELLEKGTDEEKAYCAKYFSHINDTLAIDLLRENSYSEFDPLSVNCAEALSAMKDDVSYNQALEKLKSDDEFEKLSAVRFLVAFNDLRAIDVLFDTMKHSSMPENVAAEISYLQSFLEFLDTDFKYDSILALNHIMSGLGEIISPAQVFDFQIFEILERLIALQKTEKNSKIAIVLLSSKLKFEQLTENDEYLFDETKEIKEEIYEIKKFLNSLGEKFWDEQKEIFTEELTNWSDFVYSALDLAQEFKLEETLDKLKELLKTDNQTLILRTVEVIKSLNRLDCVDEKEILGSISDTNIKAVVQSIFGN